MAAVIFIVSSLYMIWGFQPTFPWRAEIESHL